MTPQMAQAIFMYRQAKRDLDYATKQADEALELRLLHPRGWDKRLRVYKDAEEAESNRQWRATIYRKTLSSLLSCILEENAEMTDFDLLSIVQAGTDGRVWHQQYSSYTPNAANVDLEIIAAFAGAQEIETP